MKETTENLKTLLKEGKVHFEYTKSNGEIRQANGTLNADLIPTKYVFVDKLNAIEFTNLRYFDLDKQSWRSISKDTTEVEILG